MTQPMLRSRAPANQERGKSLGCWNREDHIRHRDYSPTLGRFIERDPIGFEAGDNNWYRFVANGPTGKVDPSGLEQKPISDATPEAKELIKILPSVLAKLEDIARGTTNEVERGGFILHVKAEDRYVVQECRNKKSGPTHFAFGERRYDIEANEYFLRRPGEDGVVDTNDPPADDDVDFGRRIMFSFHTHPPLGDPWASEKDCENARDTTKMPDVMIAWKKESKLYFVWISDTDGHSIDVTRILYPRR